MSGRGWLVAAVAVAAALAGGVSCTDGPGEVEPIIRRPVRPRPVPRPPVDEPAPPRITRWQGAGLEGEPSAAGEGPSCDRALANVEALVAAEGELQDAADETQRAPLRCGDRLDAALLGCIAAATSLEDVPRCAEGVLDRDLAAIHRAATRAAARDGDEALSPAHIAARAAALAARDPHLPPERAGEVEALVRAALNHEGEDDEVSEQTRME